MVFSTNLMKLIVVFGASARFGVRLEVPTELTLARTATDWEP